MDLIQKASNLGYKHYTEYTLQELDKLSINNINKQIEYYLIQKWLREIHNVFINIGHRPHSQKFYFTITGKYNEGEKGMLYDYDYKKYETYPT